MNKKQKSIDECLEAAKGAQGIFLIYYKNDTQHIDILGDDKVFVQMIKDAAEGFGFKQTETKQP